MRARRFAAIVIFICVIAACTCFGIFYLSYCGKEDEPLTVTGFAFDTTYTITLHKGGSNDILGECVRLCAEYEKIFSRTNKGSELAKLNEISDAYSQAVEEDITLKNKWNNVKNVNGVSFTKQEKKAIEDKIYYILYNGNEGKTVDETAETKVGAYEINSDNGSLSVPLSKDLYNLIQKGLYYCRLSEGGFDITIEPLSSLWDFKSDKKEVPDSGQIHKILDDIDYKRVQLTEQRVNFLCPGIGIDLGGIAKGYIADCLKSFLLDSGVESGIISLGGNVLCIGAKTDGESFNIGIQQPFAMRNETAMSVGVKDLSVVSSGIYERYFETEDGKLYHHILNPKTGYPYENGIYGVTIISKKSVDGDGLSTTCFALGVERGLELINSMKDTYAVFITDDGKQHYSEGFESMIYG